MTSVLQSPAYRAFLRPEEAASLSTVFDGVDVPTLFLGGESDRIVPARALEQAAARVPGSRLEWLARCGHLAPLERSQELLATPPGSTTPWASSRAGARSTRAATACARTAPPIRRGPTPRLRW